MPYCGPFQLLFNFFELVYRVDFWGVSLPFWSSVWFFSWPTLGVVKVWQLKMGIWSGVCPGPCLWGIRHRLWGLMFAPMPSMGSGGGMVAFPVSSKGIFVWCFACHIKMHQTMLAYVIYTLLHQNSIVKHMHSLSCLRCHYFWHFRGVPLSADSRMASMSYLLGVFVNFDLSIFLMVQCH